MWSLRCDSCKRGRVTELLDGEVWKQGKPVEALMSTRINKDKPVGEERACDGGVESGQTRRGINEFEHSRGQASGGPNGKP